MAKQQSSASDNKAHRFSFLSASVTNIKGCLARFRRRSSADTPVGEAAVTTKVTKPKRFLALLRRRILSDTPVSETAITTGTTVMENGDNETGKEQLPKDEEEESNGSEDQDDEAEEGDGNERSLSMGIHPLPSVPSPADSAHDGRSLDPPGLLVALRSSSPTPASSHRTSSPNRSSQDSSFDSDSHVPQPEPEVRILRAENAEWVASHSRSLSRRLRHHSEATTSDPAEIRFNDEVSTIFRGEHVSNDVAEQFFGSDWEQGPSQVPNHSHVHNRPHVLNRSQRWPREQKMLCIEELEALEAAVHALSALWNEGMSSEQRRRYLVIEQEINGEHGVHEQAAWLGDLAIWEARKVVNDWCSARESEESYVRLRSMVRECRAHCSELAPRVLLGLWGDH